MKSVSIKIEEFFDNFVAIDINPKCDESLFYQVCNVIKSKIHLLEEFEVSEFLAMGKNESRETIIEALWEYQKSLLPNYLFLSELEGENDFTFIYDKEGDDRGDFYNPETRIITITEFEENVVRKETGEHCERCKFWVSNPLFKETKNCERYNFALLNPGTNKECFEERNE